MIPQNTENSRLYKFSGVNVVASEKMCKFIMGYYICSRLFIHVYLYVFICINVIIGNIYNISLLGEDRSCFELVSIN